MQYSNYLQVSMGIQRREKKIGGRAEMKGEKEGL